MITREKNLRRYCVNFQDIENYQEALESSEQYDLHHRKEKETLPDGTIVLRSKEELIDMNLYYHRPPEELIFIRGSEHLSLHHKEKMVSAETREKISAVNTGRKVSSETRSKISAAMNGDKNPMFGTTEDKSPNWKGDQVKDHSKVTRLRRQRKREALYNSLNFCVRALIL